MDAVSFEGRPDRKHQKVLANFRARVAANPNDARAYYAMAWWWHCRRQYSAALEHYDSAVRLDATLSDALRDRASVYATCPDPTFRNGSRAVADAKLALDLAVVHGHLDSDWRRRRFLQVLAAAHAEAGDFSAAVEVQTEALEFSTTRVARQQVRERLAQLQRGEQIRSPGPIS